MTGEEPSKGGRLYPLSGVSDTHGRLTSTNVTNAGLVNRYNSWFTSISEWFDSTTPYQFMFKDMQNRPSRINLKRITKEALREGFKKIKWDDKFYHKFFKDLRRGKI